MYNVWHRPYACDINMAEKLEQMVRMQYLVTEDGRTLRFI